ncbi:MAG TPA: response regulator transcription factor [Solirubrobacteraceae bacterium]|nr:response regulator transcription factor [Solirubrobacteraceae bacterium]
MNSPATILVVEDHQTTRTFLADNLSADGYEVIEAEGVSDGRRLLENAFPDLAIVDLGLPDGDGLELLAHVRGADRIAGRLDPDLPLLVLSGRVGELDRLRGFDRGCDDYMIKPFSYHELSVRVRALLRRTRRRPAAARLRVGSLEVDPMSRQVWVRGEAIALSKKEYALLRALAGEPTRVFTREELLRGVWGFVALGHTRTLDSHAFRLRQKLNRAGDRFVINVWGVGYRLLDGPLES